MLFERGAVSTEGAQRLQHGQPNEPGTFPRERDDADRPPLISDGLVGRRSAGFPETSILPVDVSKR